MSVMVGISFTAVTVNIKVSMAVSVPSSTVMVTSAVPLSLATGLRVTVLLAPDPPKRMFASDPAPDWKADAVRRYPRKTEWD